MVKQYLRKQEIILCILRYYTNAKPIITNDNFWFMILGEDMKRKEENDYTKGYE